MKQKIVFILNKAFLILFLIGFICCSCNQNHLNLNWYLSLLEYDNHTDSLIIPDFARVKWVQVDRAREWITTSDSSWIDWQKRTGECPPDFKSLPSNPFLPDPLTVCEKGEKKIINSLADWKKQKGWVEQQVKHWITGSFPPAPDNLKVTTLEESEKEGTLIRKILLEFGPDRQARMNLEIYIPLRKQGPFPVILTQKNNIWLKNGRERGYIICFYSNNDTKDYGKLYKDYDFTVLMKWAWGASRAIDYLVTLPDVDKEKLGFYGHSRNGMMASFAGAFDERIAAVIPGSGNGILIPWRYTDIYNCQTMDELTYAFPYWFQPRLRFFIGNEHRFPIDNNFLLALVAPRAMMITSSLREVDGNSWAIKQNYNSVKNVYHIYNAEDRLFLRLRDGGHGPPAEEYDVYFDFYDYAFGRNKAPDINIDKFHNYSFDEWANNNIRINPMQFPEKDPETVLKNLYNYEAFKDSTKKKINWLLGNENAHPIKPMKIDCKTKRINNRRITENLIPFDYDLTRYIPETITIYSESGDSLKSYFYFPGNTFSPPYKSCVIFLHEFAYSTGFYIRDGPYIEKFLEKGIPVLTLEMIGFRDRIEEGEQFYSRFPDWSKMGKMVSDVSTLIDVMLDNKLTDPEYIYLTGYNIGGTVALFTAALDERVSGVAVNCAFTPLRSGNPDIEGIKTYSHLHDGLIPRLGYFFGYEKHIPVDYDAIISLIAPRKLLILSAKYDRHAEFDKVNETMSVVEKVYKHLNSKSDFTHLTRDDINRFSAAQKQQIINWVKNNIQE